MKSTEILNRYDEELTGDEAISEIHEELRTGLGETTGADDCPLCNVYNKRGYDINSKTPACDGCPIIAFNPDWHCFEEHSPYGKASEADTWEDFIERAIEMRFALTVIKCSLEA